MNPVGVAPRLLTTSTSWASAEQVITGTTTGPAGVQAADGQVETMTEAALTTYPQAGPQVQLAPTCAYPCPVSGNLTNLRDAGDGRGAQYREGSTNAPVTSLRTPGAVGTPCDWTNCASGETSNNGYATSSTAGQVATYNTFGFALPGGVLLDKVEVGLEANQLFGDDTLRVTVSWNGGASYCTNAQVVDPPAFDPNAYTYLDFTYCGGHTWALADFAGNNIATNITYVQVGGTANTINLDANAVRVTYRAAGNYALDLRYNWTAVASGNPVTLTVRGSIGDENVNVQVLTPPATWNNRLTITSTTNQTLTYTLASGEFNGGTPSVRFVDALGADAIQSTLTLDQVAMVSTVVVYRLEVIQNVTGVVGPAPALAVRGNISTGGENFNVQVWNLTSSGWDTGMAAPFTPTTAWHNLSLAADEVQAGVVRVRFVDANPSDGVQDTLTLDAVAVDFTALPDLALGPGDVSLSNGAPTRGDVVTVRVVVHNLGQGAASDVAIQLEAGNEIVSTGTLPLLSPGSDASLQLTWTVGDARNLTVTVDPQNAIQETDEGNNQVVLVVPPPTGLAPGTILLWAGVAGGAVLGLLLAFLFFTRRRKGGDATATVVDAGAAPAPGQAPHRRFGRGAAPINILPGHSYLVEEEKAHQSFGMVAQLTRAGRPALILTRKNPQNLVTEYGMRNTRMLWLTTTRSVGGQEQIVHTSLESLIFDVQRFIQANPHGAILVDGVEFLIDSNNFPAVLTFIRRIVDNVSQGEQVLLVSVAPGTLQERQLKNLEREMDVLQP